MAGAWGPGFGRADVGGDGVLGQMPDGKREPSTGAVAAGVGDMNYIHIVLNYVRKARHARRPANLRRGWRMPSLVSVLA